VLGKVPAGPSQNSAVWLRKAIATEQAKQDPSEQQGPNLVGEEKMQKALMPLYEDAQKYELQMCIYQIQEASQILREAGTIGKEQGAVGARIVALQKIQEKLTAKVIQTGLTYKTVCHSHSHIFFRICISLPIRIPLPFAYHLCIAIPA
jgi:hypothetical protein